MFWATGSWISHHSEPLEKSGGAAVRMTPVSSWESTKLIDAETFGPVRTFNESVSSTRITSTLGQSDVGTPCTVVVVVGAVVVVVGTVLDVVTVVVEVVADVVDVVATVAVVVD